MHRFVWGFVTLLSLVLPLAVLADDCNRNGVDDAEEIASGATDCDGDGILDECEVLTFVRLLDAEEVQVENPEAVQRILSMQSVDLDGDLDLDLVVGNSSETITVFRNDGTGDLNHLDTIPLSDVPGVALQPVRIEVADMDCDGDPDLVVGCDGSQRFLVMINPGDGRFQRMPFYNLGAHVRFSPGQVIVNDQDSDGDPDVAVGNPSTGYVHLFTNDGTGALSPSDEIVIISSARWLYWEDFDGDGDLDFLALGPGLGSLVRNLGDGLFALPERFVLDRDAGSLAIADFNGDGVPDMVHTSSGDDKICVRLNDGTGRFGPKRCLRLEDIQRIQVADLDGDLDLDLALGVERLQSAQGDYATVSFLLNDGDGVFRHAGKTEIVETYRFFLGDVDLDGKQDVLVTPWEPGRLLVYRQEASQTGADCNDNGVLDDCELAAGDLHDADGNGVPDECERYFHRGDADATGIMDISDAVYTFRFLFLDGEGIPCLDAADANDDGLLDLSDGLYILNFLYLGRAEPSAPGIPSFPCGRDTQWPGKPGHLGCDHYEPCS